MTDIHDLVPKNKFDSSNIERLKHLTDNEIEPYYPLFWSGYRTVIGLLLVIFCRCSLYTNQPLSL